MIEAGNDGQGKVEDLSAFRKDPIREIIELEARIADREANQQIDINALKKELGALKDSIKDLIAILETLKNFVKFVGYFEKMLVFFTKLAAGTALLYAVYKFGLTELALRMKSLGGD